MAATWRWGKLQGGGPWKILEDCPAERHNTESASMGRNGAGKPCICPRALELRPLALEKMRQASRERTRREALITLGLLPEEEKKAPVSAREKLPAPAWFRSGPWRILDGCPSEGHNTLRWARQAGPNKCICPRGEFLYKEYRENQRVRENVRAETNPLQEPTANSLLRKTPDPSDHWEAPDWERAMCSGPNIHIADKGFNTEASKAGIEDRFMAKTLCSFCPILRECRDWVLKEESPPGTWGGVWGGLDPWNRVDRDLRMVDGRIRVVPFRIGGPLDVAA